jgi:hypothetical protein
MTKNNKRNKQSKSRRSKNRESNPNTAPLTSGLVMVAKLPKPVNVPFRTRRSLTYQLSWNPALGLGGAGASTLQMSFSPGATDFRIGGVSITAPSLPNASEYSALFDQYKVEKVMVRMDYSGVNAFSNTGVANVPPLALFILDHDDPNDAVVNDLLQFPQVLTHSWVEGGYKPFQVAFKPRPLADIAGSGLSTGYAPTREAPFIRTSEITIPHYGLKMALLNNGGSASAVIGFFQVTVLYDLAFINPK